jgi:hypothetical protein
LEPQELCTAHDPACKLAPAGLALLRVNPAKSRPLSNRERSLADELRELVDVVVIFDGLPFNKDRE